MEATQSAIFNQKLMENYISVLEKTNQQLGLWTNPYEIAIGILSILIAFIAIAAAALFWLNSKEQKDSIKNFILEQEKIIRQNNRQNNKRVRAYESKLDTLISEYTKQLKSADEKSKKEIEKAIGELKREKAGIGVYASPSPSASAFLGGTISTPSVSPSSSFFTVDSPESLKCVKCGRIFEFFNPSPIASGGTSIGNLRQKIYCPYCGTENSL